MRAAVMVAGALLVAGCVGSGGPEPDGDAEGAATADAPPSPRHELTNATVYRSGNFTHSGLFARFPTEGPEAYAVNETPPGVGIPFDGGVLGIPHDSLALLRIHWFPADMPVRGDGFILEPQGPTDDVRFGVRASFPHVHGAPVPNAEVRAAFLDFMANVSAADDGRDAAGADEFIASGRPFGPGNATLYSVMIDGPFRATQLIEEAQQPPESGGDAGKMGLVGEGVGMEFRLLRKNAQASRDGEGFALSVDPRDRATFWWSGPLAHARDAPSERFAELYEALDLGKPPAVPELHPTLDDLYARHARREEARERWQLATWNQTGVYDRMPASGIHAGFEVESLDASDAIPWGEGAEDLGDLLLIGVRWHSQASDASDTMAYRFGTISIDGDLDVHGLMALDQHDEVRGLFLAWARNATTADEGTMSGWADEFAASRTEKGDVTVYQVQVPGPFRFGDLYGELRRAGALAQEWERAEWSFNVEVPVRAAHRTDPDGGGVELGAYSNGSIVFDRAGPTLLSDEELRALVLDTFSALELPEPTFDGWRSSEFFPN